MVLRALHVRFDPGDLGFERFDARLQLLDRHGVQILLCKSNDGIVGIAREEVVQIHVMNR